MDNSLFILSKQSIIIERFHICTWDIENNNSLVEIGIEFNFPENAKSVNFILVAPFLQKKDTIHCLSTNLINDSNNSKFIFNDNIKSISPINKDKRNGAILEFEDKGPLAILPIKSIFINTKPKTITLEIKRPVDSQIKTSYIRFLIQTSTPTLATTRKGITRISFIYDIKLNEKRNLPDDVYEFIKDEYSMCTVNSCYCFHIIPNTFNIEFIDQNKLKNIRELEVPAFQNYLQELEKLKEHQYVIIFNKDKEKSSYSFFTTLNRETIGTKQIMFAIGVNILCSLLFSIGALRSNLNNERSIWVQIPIEYWISLGILLIFILALFKTMNHKK